MKQLKYIIFLFMILMLLLLKTPHRSSVNSDPSFHFTFVSPIAWNNIASGIVHADQEFHTDTKLICCSRLDPDLQIAALEAAIYSNPDGIITAGIEDNEELRAVLLKAKEKEIPVVLVDSDLSDSGRICYIGSDNFKAGQLAGKDMYEATNGQANIGVIVSNMTATNQNERLEGFLQEIEKYSDLSIEAIIEGESDLLILNEKIPEMLEKHPNINALLCMEGFSSDVVGKILKRLGQPYNEITVIAFDFVAPSVQYLEEGTYHSIIAQSPYKEGYLAVSTLVDYLNGQTVDNIIYTDVESITKHNLKDEVNFEYENHNWHIY